MAGIVTKLNRAKRLRCSNSKFRRTLRWYKKSAHRVDRRKAREALKQGQEYHSIPRLTSWDIV